MLKGSLNCTLALGRRWLAARSARHRAQHRHQLCLDRLGLRAALGGGQGRRARDDPLARGRVGRARRAAERDRARARSRPRAPGSGWCRGPTSRARSRPGTRWAAPGEHRELADLAAYLLADGSAYINGEVVTIDGGEWLKGAGQFSFLMEMLGEDDWQALRPRRSADAGQEKSMRRWLAAVLAVIALVAAGARGRALPDAGAPRTRRQQGEVPIGGPFTLTDQNGRDVTDAGLPRPADAGLFRLHLLPRHLPARACRRSPRRSTSCRRRCRTGGAGVHHRRPGARHGGGDEGLCRPVLDPRLVGLTGSEAAIAEAIRAYRVYASKAETEAADGSYLVDHSTFTYLMDRDGQYLTHFGHATTPEEMAAEDEAAGRRRAEALAIGLCRAKRYFAHRRARSSMDRASDYGSEGWRFESFRARHLNQSLRLPLPP